MAVKTYRSTDASAPVLTGQAGSLVSLLDACLVNGYGAIASMGWTKPFSGTNLAVYQQPAGTNGMCLRVDDTGTTHARTVAYETMTSVSAGTNPFPSAAQLSGGNYVQKSTTADSVARPWLLHTNGKIFYLLIAVDSGATYPVLGNLVFGDVVSYKPGDAFHTVHIGAYNTGTTMAGNLMPCTYMCIGISTAMAGHTIARAYTQAGTSTTISKVTNTGFAGITASRLDFSYAAARPAGGNQDSSVQAQAFVPIVYPNSSDGGLYMDKFYLFEGNNSLRGELPGIWIPMHIRPATAQGDTWSGAGALAGKTFEAYLYTCSFTAQLVLETSDTW